VKYAFAIIAVWLSLCVAAYDQGEYMGSLGGGSSSLVIGTGGISTTGSMQATGAVSNTASVSSARLGTDGASGTLILDTGANVWQFDNNASNLRFINSGAVVAQLQSNGAALFSDIQSIGAVPTTTGSTCASVGTPIGGNTVGVVIVTCTAQTLVLNFAAPSSNGWSCDIKDLTTPADTMAQSATLSTTSATFTGTTAAGDHLMYKCIGF
jgi:hypothetical protein